MDTLKLLKPMPDKAFSRINNTEQNTEQKEPN